VAYLELWFTDVDEIGSSKGGELMHLTTGDTTSRDHYIFDRKAWQSSDSVDGSGHDWFAGTIDEPSRAA